MSSPVNPHEYPFEGYVLIDVRSEDEFLRGHIPGAINIPLLPNQDRVAVGTCYKASGRDAAVALGFQLIGPRFHALYQSFKEAAGGKKPLFYCWRGGLRSQISSTIMAWGGFSVHLLKGGYKAYRNHVQAGINQPREVLLLGGLTGVGKTQILGLLKEKGYPAVDLEGLASHKGSVLGSLGMEGQPTVEMFENLLWQALQPLSKVILESESRKIGTCILPQGLWDAMLQAPVLEIEVSEEQRTIRLTEEYAHYDAQELALRTEKLRKRLGGLVCEQAKTAILSGEKKEWVQLMMRYYDKTYAHFTQEQGYHPVGQEWNWDETESSLALLMTKINQYGFNE